MVTKFITSCHNGALAKRFQKLSLWQQRYFGDIQENLIINGIKILHLSTHRGGGSELSSHKNIFIIRLLGFSPQSSGSCSVKLRLAEDRWRPENWTPVQTCQKCVFLNVSVLLIVSSITMDVQCIHVFVFMFNSLRVMLVAQDKQQCNYQSIILVMYAIPFTRDCGTLTNGTEARLPKSMLLLYHWPKHIGDILHKMPRRTKKQP